MGAKSVVDEARQIRRATELVLLGARLQVLESESALSRERLLRLYKEVKGASPPKGMLPFSADWFLPWRPNIHASLFADMHGFLVANAGVSGIEATMSAYRLYQEHLHAQAEPELMSFTRAWMLMKFLDSRLLGTRPCDGCGGRFVVHSLDLHREYVCGLCRPPVRAGKTAARIRSN